MKNPLCYQMTEYDCGPTSLLNAVSFLFEREQIPPELVRSVMLFCLDCFGADGAVGKCGTSCMAMQFLCSWLEGFGRAGHLPMRASYLSLRQGRPLFGKRPPARCAAPWRRCRGAP